MCILSRMRIRALKGEGWIIDADWDRSEESSLWKSWSQRHSPPGMFGACRARVRIKNRMRIGGERMQAAKWLCLFGCGLHVIALAQPPAGQWDFLYPAMSAWAGSVSRFRLHYRLDRSDKTRANPDIWRPPFPDLCRGFRVIAFKFRFPLELHGLEQVSKLSKSTHSQPFAAL